METTFYDDSQFGPGKNDGKTLKRPGSLDLHSPNTASKKQKVPILTTPDLNKFVLNSPDVEIFIKANYPNGFTMGTLAGTPTQILFPKNVTEEQENYAKGFLDALNHLHHVDMNNVHVNFNSENSTDVNVPKMFTNLGSIYLSPATSVIKSLGSPNVLTTLNPTIRPPSVDSNNSSSCNSNSMPVPLEYAVKEEFQTVPSDFSSPPVSPLNKPIDMKDQERIKLERKRHRNRIAASKCRRRKLEKISQLEAKVKELKGENVKLEEFADRLREQVCSLKQTVLDHFKKGCQIMVHESL